MKRPCINLLVIVLSMASAVPAFAASSGSAREFLGQAAFGFQQVDVLLAALAAILVLFIVSTVARQYWLAEVAFLLLVAGGLVSNAIGMIALTMISLFSVLGIGLILDKLGFSAQLTPQEMQRVEERVSATMSEDLGVDAKALRARQRPDSSSPAKDN